MANSAEPEGLAREGSGFVEVEEKSKDPHDFAVKIAYHKQSDSDREGDGEPERVREHLLADHVVVEQAEVKSGEERGDGDTLTDSDDSPLIPKEATGNGVGADESGDEVRLEDGKHQSSIMGASFNFINSIVGAGIIGIPAALREAGFVAGLLLLLLVAGITDYTVVLLIKDGIIAGKMSYQEMVTSAFGRPGYVVLTIVQFLFPFFAMAGYIVIVGDTFSRIIKGIFILSHHEFIPVLVNTRLIKVIMVMLVMMPISFLRNISQLEKFSAVAILCVMFILGVSVYQMSQLFCAVRCFIPSCCDSPFTDWGINKEFIPSIGIMAFAFVCHHNTYLIYGSLKNRSLTRFATVSHISVSSSFIFCLVLGLSGFITFMGETQGDLLNNYCNDVLSNIARLSFATVIMLTYPIECFVIREVVEISLNKLPYKAISWIPSHSVRKVMDRFLYSPRHKSLLRHVVLTLLIVTGTLAIGLTTDDLAVVLAFTGCFTATPLAFILPTASFLKLSKKRWCSRQKIITAAILVFGVIVMVIGTVMAVVQAINSYRNPDLVYTPENVPPYCSSNCCLLLSATNNLTLSHSSCNCQQLCPNQTYLTNLISANEYCSLSNSNFTI